MAHLLYDPATARKIAEQAMRRHVESLTQAILLRVRRRDAMFRLAYQRPCFICEKSGPCRHREPEVEAAFWSIQL